MIELFKNLVSGAIPILGLIILGYGFGYFAFNFPLTAMGVVFVGMSVLYGKYRRELKKIKKGTNQNA